MIATGGKQNVETVCSFIRSMGATVEGKPRYHRHVALWIRAPNGRWRLVIRRIQISQRLT